MRETLFKFNNRAIKIIFYIFFTATFIFALTSSNLILGDNPITRIGTTAFTTVVLLLIGALFTICYVNHSVRDFLLWLFVDRSWITATVCFVLAILWQIVFVSLIHYGVHDDVGAVHAALTNTKDVNIIGYFSVNPNNLGLLLLQHQIALIFHHTSWMFFDFMTIFMVDLAALFNLGSVFVIDKSKIPILLYLQAMWMALFPAIVVPYTDTWVLPFVAFYILCYVIVARSNMGKALKLVFAVLGGFTVGATYFIKPSGIVPMIAIIIIELISLFNKNKKHWIWLLLVTSVFALGAGSSYYKFNHAIDNQTYIHVNTFRAKPMIHFINMGLSKTGGYNAKDSYKMVILINKKDRINYSVKSIKKRLHKMGFGGYIKFLIVKQKNNTSDGTFGWLREGISAPSKYTPDKHGFKGKLENFVLLYGNNVGDFRFLTQIFWCIWLGLIFFAWKDNRKIIQILRLALVGGFIFLLIFEGGRSRYLIQFIPVFLILATLEWKTSVQQVRRLLKWNLNPGPKHRKNVL